MGTKWREENEGSACPLLFESMISGISHIKFSSTMLSKVSISFSAVIKGHAREDIFLWLFMLFTSDRDWNHSWPVSPSSPRQFKWTWWLQQWLKFNFCCIYILCDIFCERDTGVLRIGCCQWAHSLDLSGLIFPVWNTSKSAWGWETEFSRCPSIYLAFTQGLC